MTFTVRTLRRTFGDNVAVDDVSFSIPTGQVTGFVGGNGAGKTTTMRMMMGVSQPDSGDVLWDGEPVTRELRRQMGYMPEERGLYSKQPVLAQLVYLAQLRGMDAGDATREATERLTELGLGDRLKDKVEKLSLGNQQRVQIVAALMGNPIALVLDEPFSGLDPDGIDLLTGMLEEMAASGVAVLFSSHQLDVVQRICHRLVIIAQGTIRAEGTVDELRASMGESRRITVSGSPAFINDIPGVMEFRSEGNTAWFATSDVDQTILTAALERGDVHDFTIERPTLAQVYKEVSA